MKDLLEGINNWVQDGKEFCIATVTKTWRSAPRPEGSSMLISSEGEMLGSVSGGCVEKSVITACREIFADNKPSILTYGVGDEDAWNVGLSCGGRIEVFAEKFPLFISKEEKELWLQLKEKLSANEEAAWVSEMTTGNSSHYLVVPGVKDGRCESEIYDKALQLLETGSSEVFELGNKKYFIQVFPQKNRLMMIGSAHITSELLKLARIHDFESIVIDPRDTFATKTEHSVKPDQLFVNWPQEILQDLRPDKNTFAVILSHDPKIDDAALEILLRSKVRYIGALGSTRTHGKRKQRLAAMGFSAEDIARIHAPVGLRINALSAKEIALSVMAEIIGVKNSGQ